MIAPTIAVVISNYNYAKYLPAAIESVLNQIIPFDEIIVVDDGSTDNSCEVMMQYIDQIKILSIANGGQLGANRVGIMATVSDYIYTLDADDFAMPELVTTVKSALTDAKCRPAKLQFQLNVVSEDAKPQNSFFPTYPSNYNHEAILHDNLAHGFYISPPTSGNVFSREALIRLGFNTFEASGFIDAASSLAMPYLGEVICINEVLANYRVHHDSASGWSKPDIPLLRKELHTFRQTWDEVIGALELLEPNSIPSRPLYVDERLLMIACMEHRWFIGKEVYQYLLGLWQTNTVVKQRILLTAWAFILMLPSSAWRNYAIRTRRSAVNRSRRLQQVINLLRFNRVRA